ncbi:phosphatase [Streptacidiphilus sp. ASG 303]|uniref:phosphatase n=1 Tax=Streptacidiphilus sp. ASG 303 TaxID=2896847 RepID=UPI001E2C90B1|nr:phosphatase [Streptacidiphilus sp. ASG 303]MCD0483351.1 phosphatase [Streptacidiphilus sp. ASG 303]
MSTDAEAAEAADVTTGGAPGRAPSRAGLLAHLTASRIAGEVATTRENNLDHYRALAEGDRYYWLGLELGDRWADESAVLAVMAERCGVVADPGHVRGQDTIGAELCADALERMAAVLREAVGRRARVLFATGHPGGVLAVHRELARALAGAGCTVVVPRDLPLPPDGTGSADGASGADGADGRRRREVRAVDRVAVLHEGSRLLHTHEPGPMRAVLDVLEADGGLPDLVVADHGWAGHAGLRGIETVGFADCNDPALFLAEAEGTLRVTVPLDDNVSPELYGPLTAYLLAEAGLGG